MTSEQSELLRTLQQDSFSYFVHQTHPANELVRDKSREGWPASIAAIGLALAAYPVDVECGFITRDDAVQRQARQAQPLREGENLLPNAPDSSSSEEPARNSPAKSGSTRTSP